jgi:hypothetical protein
VTWGATKSGGECRRVRQNTTDKQTRPFGVQQVGDAEISKKVSPCLTLFSRLLQLILHTIFPDFWASFPGELASPFFFDQHRQLVNPATNQSSALESTFSAHPRVGAAAETA